MPSHPAFAAGCVAVVTGAASGIGLAAAERFAAMGLRLCLADLPGAALDAAVDRIAALSPSGRSGVIGVPTDVSRLDQVEALKAAAFGFGEVSVLMNNAGTAPGGGPWDNIAGWQRVLGVNLWGVVHGLQVFTEAMLAQDVPGAIISTGSKQGITCPPGDTAYNASKAGVKVVTEALAHGLRNAPGGHISAHLLIPGSTYTGMTRGAGGAKPAGAWTPAQVVDELVAGMARGDFYILCPDNEVTRGIDHRRILWAAQDITRNRPALSRWHPDHAEAFATFLKRRDEA